jgi:hypothetical protein
MSNCICGHPEIEHHLVNGNEICYYEHCKCEHLLTEILVEA